MLPGGSPSLTKRPAIDGLRGIAILLVVAFHAHVPGLTGGFAGVDVFFVISGYLITRLLLREWQLTGTIAFSAFYARRVRRLIPALAVLLVVMLATSAVLLPDATDRRSLGASAVAAALFSANFLFIRRTNDYFADTNRPDLLTHTWSLSVEEQFYFVWPLLLLFGATLGKRLGFRGVPLAILGIVAIGSFVATGLTPASQSWVFYSPVTRIWELALGGTLAWWLEMSSQPRAPGGLLGAYGILAIVVSGFALDATIVTGAWRLLLPTLGALAVILVIETAPISVVPRILGSSALEAVGKVSYGWYLWHFPALILLQRSPLAGTAGTIAVVFGSFGVAVLSYRFIEAPVRGGKLRLAISDRRALIGGMAAMLAVAAAGFTVRLQALRVAPTEHVWIRERCPMLTSRDLEKRVLCPLGSADSTTAVILAIGDSHVLRLAALLDDFGKRAGVRIVMTWEPACAPLIGFVSPLLPDAARCQSYVERALSDIGANRHGSVSGVLVAARWTRQFGNPPRDTSARADFVARLGSANSMQIGRRADSALRTTVHALMKSGVRVLLVAQPPEFDRNPGGCAVTKADDCGTDLAGVRAHSARSLQSLRVSSTEDGVRLLELQAFFCGPTRCSPFRKGIRAYDDAHHLSIAGARSLISEAWCDLSWLSKVDAVPRGASTPCSRRGN